MTAAIFRALGSRYGFTMETPLKDFTQQQRQVLFWGTSEEKIEVVYDRAYGSGKYQMAFEGIVPMMERRYHQTQSQGMKEYYESLMSQLPCPDCGGKRLRREARAVTVGDMALCDLTELSVVEELAFFERLALTQTQRLIADQILKEIRSRLGFLRDVGLEYLTLSRSAGSLSGGEASVSGWPRRLGQR